MTVVSVFEWFKNQMNEKQEFEIRYPSIERFVLKIVREEKKTKNKDFIKLCKVLGMNVNDFMEEVKKMRGIEFRGRRSYDKKWIYGSLLIDNNGDFHILESNIIEKDGHHIQIDSDSPMFFDNETIGQFTGLCDKNGVKIFEGDIVKIYKPFTIPQIAKVTFNDGCYDVVGITLTFRDYLKCFVANHAIEVIGNIHEKENEHDE